MLMKRLKIQTIKENVNRHPLIAQVSTHGGIHMSICLHTLLLKYNNDFLDIQSSGKGKGGIVKLLQWKAYDFPQLVSDMIFYCKSEYLVSSDITKTSLTYKQCGKGRLGGRTYL